MSSHQKYYTSLIFTEYFNSKKMTTITVNDVVYQVSDLANMMSSMLPSSVSETNYEAGTIPGVTVKYDGQDVGTISITGFAKPTTSDLNAQNTAIATDIKNEINGLKGTLDISNLTFPTDSNAKSFNVQQVLMSSHQKYYTSLIFTEYFNSKKMTTITVNDVVYQVSDLANMMSSMLPSSVSETNYEAGTIPGVTVKYDGQDVGTISITGFAKPTTSDLNAQNNAIATDIKNQINDLKGTLDLTKIKFTDNNPTVFTVQEVINSKHQKYYTTWIFEQYFANSNISTITVNGIQYTVLQIANQMSSIIPLNPTSSEIKSGTISNISINFNGIDVGTINITGFKTATTNQTSSNN